LLAVVALHWATATFTPLDVRRLAPRGCCNVQHMAMAGGTSTKPMVIIGGGKAGAPQPRLCATRVSGGPVMIISGEPGISTGRPLLSKTYMRSEEDFESWYVKPADWYAAHGVELPGRNRRDRD
jgi:NAD(P)H-nitrite reductase large subunit